MRRVALVLACLVLSSTWGAPVLGQERMWPAAGGIPTALKANLDPLSPDLVNPGSQIAGTEPRCDARWMSHPPLVTMGNVDGEDLIVTATVYTDPMVAVWRYTSGDVIGFAGGAGEPPRDPGFRWVWEPGEEPPTDLISGRAVTAVAFGRLGGTPVLAVGRTGDLPRVVFYELQRDRGDYTLRPFAFAGTDASRPLGLVSGIDFAPGPNGTTIVGMSTYDDGGAEFFSYPGVPMPWSGYSGSVHSLRPVAVHGDPGWNDSDDGHDIVHAELPGAGRVFVVARGAGGGRPRVLLYAVNPASGELHYRDGEGSRWEGGHDALSVDVGNMNGERLIAVTRRTGENDRVVLYRYRAGNLEWAAGAGSGWGGGGATEFGADGTRYGTDVAFGRYAGEDVFAVTRTAGGNSRVNLYTLDGDSVRTVAYAGEEWDSAYEGTSIAFGAPRGTPTFAVIRSKPESYQKPRKRDLRILLDPCETGEPPAPLELDQYPQWRLEGRIDAATFPLPWSLYLNPRLRHQPPDSFLSLAQANFYGRLISRWSARDNPLPGNRRRLRDTQLLLYAALEPQNAARNTNPRQSSVVLGAGAARAIDGDTDGHIASGSVSVTASSSGSYWETSLEWRQIIDGVRIYPRTDCCYSGMQSLDVSIAVGQSQSWSTSVDLEPGTLLPYIDIAVPGVLADRVRVTSRSGGIAAAEIEILPWMPCQLHPGGGPEQPCVYEFGNWLRVAGGIAFDLDFDELGRAWHLGRNGLYVLTSPREVDETPSQGGGRNLADLAEQGGGLLPLPGLGSDRGDLIGRPSIDIPRTGSGYLSELRDLMLWDWQLFDEAAAPPGARRLSVLGGDNPTIALIGGDARVYVLARMMTKSMPPRQVTSWQWWMGDRRYVDVALAPDGSLFAAREDGIVVRADGRSDTIVVQTPPGVTRISVAPDGHLWVLTNRGAVYEVPETAPPASPLDRAASGRPADDLVNLPGLLPGGGLFQQPTFLETPAVSASAMNLDATGVPWVIVGGEILYLDRKQDGSRTWTFYAQPERGGVEARDLAISNSGRPWHLGKSGEIYSWGVDPLMNVSSRGVPSQSSGDTAGAALDGRLDRPGMSTEAEFDPWWEVRFASAFVQNVVVHAGPGQTSLQNFRIVLYDENGDEVWGRDYDLVGEQRHVVIPVQSAVNAAPAGVRLRITRRPDRVGSAATPAVLQLGEVQVFGLPY